MRYCAFTLLKKIFLEPRRQRRCQLVKKNHHYSLFILSTKQNLNQWSRGPRASSRTRQEGRRPAQGPQSQCNQSNRAEARGLQQAGGLERRATQTQRAEAKNQPMEHKRSTGRRHSQQQPVEPQVAPQAANGRARTPARRQRSAAHMPAPQGGGGNPPTRASSSCPKSNAVIFVPKRNFELCL